MLRKVSQVHIGPLFSAFSCSNHSTYWASELMYNVIIKRFLLISLLTTTSLWAFPISTLGHIANRNAALPQDQQGLPDGTVGGGSR